MKKIIFLVMIATLVSMEAIAQQSKLNSGQTVIVRTTTAVASKAKSTSITAIVDRDVRDASGEKVLIRRGTPVEMSIVAKKARGVGKGGMIDLTCISTTAVDGQNVALLGGLNVQGDDNKGAALGCGLGLGLTFLFPEGLFFLCLKGENVEVPANTLIQNVVVNDNYMIRAEE